MIGNFPVSGVPLSQFPEVLRSLARIKMVAAQANLAPGMHLPGGFSHRTITMTICGLSLKVQ